MFHDARRGLTIAAALLALAVCGAPATAAPELRLAEFAFDPVAGEPELPAGWDRAGSTAEPDVQIVQFDGPVTDERLAELERDGFVPIRYVYPDAFLVWGSAADRAALRARPAVRWSGDFAPAYKVQPQWRDLDGARRDVNVLLVGGAPAERAVAALEALGAVATSRRRIDEMLEVAGMRLAGDRFREAAAVAGVISIQPRPTDLHSRGELSAQLDAGNVDMSGLAVPGYPAWLAGLGLSGAGVTIAHVDEGADETHPDLAARIAPCVGSSCSATVSQHGTHTAGILVGDASSGAVDSYGFLVGQGVAPGASIVEQVYNPIALEPGGMLDLMTDSHANGAVVSNNSWGRSSFALGYDIHTLLVDTGVRDADPMKPGLQPLIYVQAIDNGEGGTSTQGVPDDAKNIITVGATMALTTDQDPAANPNDLADVTAHGPARDGRTIPHLVAPGCFVYSTWPTGFGADHGGMCGTSMAAPQVAGAAALFVERQRAAGRGTPSPALVKAALLPVAHDLAGSLDADGATMGHRPDSRQGWGRLDLGAVVDPPSGAVLYEDQTQVFHGTGQEWLRVVTPADPALPIRVMLAWTDAPGHGLGGATPAWNNDLDLVVETGGSTYLGNVFGPDGLSATGGAADPANNAEGVFLAGLAPGAEVTLRVVASNVNSDGVPGNGDATDQDFALACYNCALVPAFAVAASPARLDVCAPDEPDIAVVVEALAGYSSDVDLTVSGLPAGMSAAFGVDPIAPGQATTLSLLDTASATDGDFDLIVEGVTPDWSRESVVQLRLRQAPPVVVTPAAPASGATGVDARPVLSWAPAPWTDRYLVEVAADPAFDALVYGAVETSTSHELGVVLDDQTTYYWRVRGANGCGVGAFSAGVPFTTGTATAVLLVDDDGDLPDVQGAFTGVLDDLGVAYDVWDVWGLEGGNEPDAATLARYRRIVWFTGREEVYAGPSRFTEDDLADWLDRGGCLAMSSADYILNGGLDAFVRQRFGVASVTEDTGQDDVAGAGSVFGGVPASSLLPSNPDYADVLVPDGTAEAALSGDQGTAAIDKDTGWYRTFFSGFGLERLPAASGARALVLQTFLAWCDGLAGLDGDGDGVVNADDCVDGDPGAWGAPGEVTDLRLGADEFTWSVPVGGSGAAYDVLRSDDPIDFYNATCVATAVEATTAYGDPVEPGPGEIFFYLARARNACGQSSLGELPGGAPRHGTACE